VVKSFAISQKGKQTLTWDGKNNNGNATATGVYFVKLQADKAVRVHKILMVK
jgi:flagellar hook assembly protein FlgD